MIGVMQMKVNKWCNEALQMKLAFEILGTHSRHYWGFL
jgi:hypothetical protein